jgi:membrane protein YdbS with pleckstrin-like domain
LASRRFFFALVADLVRCLASSGGTSCPVFAWQDEVMSEIQTKFQTRLLPSESLILEARPSPNVVWVWLFTRALPAAFMMGGFAFFAWIFIDTRAGRGAPPPYTFSAGIMFVSGWFIFGWLAAHIYNLFLVRTYLYRVTSHRFVFAGGILRRTTHAVEHRRVTDVQFSQNILEQALSLGCVNLSTPGTVNGGASGKNRSMPELRLEGLVDGAAVFEAITNCVRASHGPAV